ncbi:MAG TPA: nickel pincer cofactor biosynthesis protein LarB [Thermomonospora sp.]|nr:nickel pincer cofactor biosynthesis protein LarB [Thermomonospora sp.]
MSRPVAVSAEAGDLSLADIRERVTALLARDAEAAFLRRADLARYEAAREIVPGASYNARSGLVTLTGPRPVRGGPPVAVLSAGTADGPVAEEAVAALAAFGLPVERVADVGVAGLHRLLAARPVLDRARVLLVVAGMDGALPSVVARMTDRPVVAVPTSVGYGASFGGLAALAAALTAGAPGLVTTGIDDGLGAAALAWRMLR